MDAVAGEALDRAAGAEHGAGLQAQDTLLLQELLNPAVPGLQLAAAGFLAIGELHGRHTGATGAGQLQGWWAQPGSLDWRLRPSRGSR